MTADPRLPANVVEVFLDAIVRESIEVEYLIGEGLPQTAAARAKRVAQYAFELYPQLRQVDDPMCKCGFAKHSHHRYSNICPVLLKGVLSMFQEEK